MKKLLLLTLMPVFGLLLSNNCFALQHNYDSFLTAKEFIAPPFVQGDDNLYYFNFSSTDFDYAPAFRPNSYLYFSVPSSDTSSFSPYNNQYSYHLSFNDSQFSLNSNVCTVSTFPYSNLPSSYVLIGDWYHSNHSVFISTRSTLAQGGYSPSGSNACYSIPNNFTYSYNESLGGNYWNSRDYNLNITNLRNSSLPRTFRESHAVNSYDAISLSQSGSYQSNGVSYTTSFSFSKLFDGNDVQNLRSLHIPLNDIDGYFLKYQNVYSGRSFEWHISFHFDNLTLPSDLSQSFAQINIRGQKRNNGVMPTNGGDYQSFTCTMTTTGIGDSQSNVTVDFTCPVTLSDDWAGFSVYFDIGNNNDDYLFHTTAPWKFMSAYLVSDNDYTPGDSFNSDLRGDMWGINNGEPYSGDPDWISSLKNLFAFGLPVGNTPLGLILGGFSNQESCASIPTIAGMINSNETQVCPFFPATVRAVTTPVLALFSVCLVFGAFMSWLGGSSGNFIEDSSPGHTFKVGKHIGSVRTKGGK